MQNSIWIAVFLLIILPMLERRRRRNAIIKHVLYNKKRNKENNKMKELAKQFIGKECIVYTVTGSDGIVKGTIKDVADDGIIIERGDGIEAVNLDYVTRIRSAVPFSSLSLLCLKKQKSLQKKGFSFSAEKGIRPAILGQYRRQPGELKNHSLDGFLPRLARPFPSHPFLFYA